MENKDRRGLPKLLPNTPGIDEAFRWVVGWIYVFEYAVIGKQDDDVTHS